MSKRYAGSEAMLERALKTIPLGTQTFSKSKTQYPYGVSPFYIARGKGSHVWDVDGNEYIDFVSGLASITLGYNDPDVTAAVKTQLEDGVLFSLPHPIEVKTAEKIIELVPCAEMVRFGKNGSDATTAAIRLARAYTNRDHVAVCGYHGWQDWYIGSTSRNMGVPESTQRLTHKFTYNNLDSLHDIFKEFPGDVAAVILEPMNSTNPDIGFLESVKELTHQHGAVLIFDEIVTGFRFSEGGAQELFGVAPDLATFGKGMANGYPLAALTGSAEIMKLCEEIFFSFTFGGEALSLAAAHATMTKLQQEPVLETIRQRGIKLMQKVNALIQLHRVDYIFSITGHPSWSFLFIRDVIPYTAMQIKTLFLQEMFKRGILMLGTHNMSYAHTDDDIEALVATYDQVFLVIKNAVEERKLEAILACKPLEMLFKIR